MEKEIYFAPLEGITGRTFRTVFHRHFKGVSEYYTPFITPKEKRGIDKKDIREISPENNMDIKLIPQILTSEAGAFRKTASKLLEFGYEEVNLNLGCPSGTVVNKGRGSGVLKDLEALERLLDEIFEDSLKKGFRISLKTRVGFWETSEFLELLQIYRKYPIEKLIIHPRTRMEYYKGKVHKECIKEALEVFLGKEDRLCFNGDILTEGDFEAVVQEFPKISSVMIGRGFLRNPFLIEEIRKAGEANVQNEVKKETIKKFLDELFYKYVEDVGDERVAVLKMKELWSYLKDLFQAEEGFEKEIRKAKNGAEYRAAVNVIFSNYDLG